MSKLTIEELEMLNPDQLGWLLLAEASEISPDVQFIQDLLDVGCPIEARNPLDYTALHITVIMGNLEPVKLLTSAGADIHARNHEDQTALHLAVICEMLDVVKFLISIGADIHARNHLDYTPCDLMRNKYRESIPELEPND